MNEILKMTRAANMDLLRWKHGGSNRLQKTLKGLFLPHYVSAWALGNKELSDYGAQLIAAKLDLPANWFDRDNCKFLFQSQEDYDAVSQLLDACPEQQSAVRTLLPKRLQVGDVRTSKVPQLRVVGTF